MELTRPRPVGGEAAGGGRRMATHDFLSLCTLSSSSSSTLHQDPPLPPPPPPPRENNTLKTLDFLGRTMPSPSSVEHSLPGGIGTYSLSNVSYFTNNIPLPKPFSEMTGMRPVTVVPSSSEDRTNRHANSGFTLREESAGKKGKTRKENAHSAATAVRDPEVRLGRWSTSDRPAQLSSSIHRHRSSFSSFSSSQPLGQMNRGFVDMMKSAKGSSSQEDEFDGGEETEVMVKKERSPVPTEELSVKIDGQQLREQKVNTPRSRHSATEQRRRSKINDRIQMLRALIPRSDQKRDRASFLSEVIEYIRILQEKVTQCEEGSYQDQGWTYEPEEAMMSSRTGQNLGNIVLDQSRSATNGLDTTMSFATKVDKENDSMMSGTPPETNVSSATTFKESRRDVSKPRTVECSAALNTKLKKEGFAIEDDLMSFSNSNAYSHELLNILKKVLQSSGVDLSQASISVQIDLGKRGNPSAASTSPFPKDVNTASVRCVTRTQIRAEDSEMPTKKPKTCEAKV